MSNSLFLKPSLLKALEKESLRFRKTYLWLQKAMPSPFFEEVDEESLMLITHSLMGFHLQDYFSTIHLKNGAIVICLDSDDADLRILKNYEMYGIKYYQAYLSKKEYTFDQKGTPLRIATLYFTEVKDTEKDKEECFNKTLFFEQVSKHIPEMEESEFEGLMKDINKRFLKSVSNEKLLVLLKLFHKAKTSELCEHEVHYNESWKENNLPSMVVTLAWKNTPKHNFLYRIARHIHRNELVIKRVNASYINPYSAQSILLLSLELHGKGGKACWDAASIPDFLRDLSTVKYFACFDQIDSTFVRTKILSNLEGNILRALVNFVHQTLALVNHNVFTLQRIELDLCRHPDLTKLILVAFCHKFDPIKHSVKGYEETKERFFSDLKKLDTGNEENDHRRKHVLEQAMNFVIYCQKTNAFLLNYQSLGFRLDPLFLTLIPFSGENPFHELPYGVFFFKGMHFFGFHIRFKDLSRGGLRTVFPEELEKEEFERNRVLLECYGLAYTQHKKNKDIAEGGSKGIIFLKPYDRINSELLIYKEELSKAGMSETAIEEKTAQFLLEQKLELLYQAQKSYIHSLLTLVNCEEDGRLKEKGIRDFYQKPEYIYLGPDENMHDIMIDWIANLSKKMGYLPGSCFISGKPNFGINHKKYGVTSKGVHIYMIEALLATGIDPREQPFTIKMSGGPDGDVAGNEILNLAEDFKKTAKLIALTDISGTIYDPEGLEFDLLVKMFHEMKSIRNYPAAAIHEGGFLLDRFDTVSETAYSKKNRFVKKQNGQVVEEFISANEMNHLYRFNVHKTKADVFIPAGGRPRALNQYNIDEFLDDHGKPTASIIIEGANLYLSEKARAFLEKLGTLIIKDSSANKAGVICSSLEVLCGLILSDEEFFKEKEALVKEIIEHLKTCALLEAKVLLKDYKKGSSITTCSDALSQKINSYQDEISLHLDTLKDPSDNPLFKHAFYRYFPKTLRESYKERLSEKIPINHKKAIIAAEISSSLIYSKGLTWNPSIIDILPILLEKN